MTFPPPPPDDFDKTIVITGDAKALDAELQRAKDQQACLIIIRGTPQGQRFFLTMPEMIIGRDPSADIVLADQTVSKKHARVLTEAGQPARLIDLGSSNGTFVNDRRRPPGEASVLVKEDMIKVGNTIMKYLPAGELEILFYGSLGAAAHSDPLTRIYNKGYLLEALEAEFKRAKALHADLSLVMFDLDHFKHVNDGFGHDAGDYALKEFAHLIRSQFLRPKDVFARYGGEEFVVLLANTNARTAGEVAERIRAAIQAHPFVYDGARLPITTSMGVADLHTDMDAAVALLKRADTALYAAKAAGRNRVVVASDAKGRLND